MSNSFKYHPLGLVNPEFGSNLTNLVIELDALRRKTFSGTTHPLIFFQLKKLFHILESIGSARIEGNNTTIAEYIETKIETQPTKNGSEKIREIQNVEKALQFIDQNIDSIIINRAFISEIHKMVVDGLIPAPDGDGDATPGQYRIVPVTIKNAKHIPPENQILVDQYMEELFDFIATNHGTQYDLLKTAIAHHRFVWIYPFRNGNGRTVRLFTYTMLLKQGFKIDMLDRILNPTAVFCNNRDTYYDMLSGADTGATEGMLIWCEYVLSGLKDEMQKIDKLADYKYLTTEILLPAIAYSEQRKLITDTEAKILKKVIEKQEIQNSDLKEILGDKDVSIISRTIKKLVNQHMLKPIKEGARKYTLCFESSYLIRGVMNALGDKGFLPIN
jgi:Fic family protein